MSSDDPFGSGGGDWQEPPQPQQADDNIDMNYGQPLPPQGGGAPAPGSQPVQHTQGGPLQPAKNKLENEDVIALVLTFIIPGVGHMMLGQMKKGIAIMAATYLTCGTGYLLTIVFAVDAYLVAMTKKYRAIDDWEVFPDMNKHLGSG